MPHMCIFAYLACSSVAQPGAHEQDVVLLGRDQLANLHIFYLFINVTKIYLIVLLIFLVLAPQQWNIGDPTSVTSDPVFAAMLKSKGPKHPKFKCFLKQVNNAHLILTFVPASFTDLKLLMLSDASMNGLQTKAVSFFNSDVNKAENSKNSHCGRESDMMFHKDIFDKIEDAGSIPESQSVPEMKEPSDVQFNVEVCELRNSLHHIDTSSPLRVRANSLDTMAKKPGLTDIRKRTRTCSMDSRHKKKYSLQPLSPPHFEQNCPEQKATLTPEKQKMVIPLNHVPNYGAITFPIFVYDCPLSSMMDILVYKEHEKRPRDIYEDNTYSYTSEDLSQHNLDEAKTNNESLNTTASPEPKSEESETSFGM
jgi:hypothetical protein